MVTTVRQPDCLFTHSPSGIIFGEKRDIYTNTYMSQEDFWKPFRLVALPLAVVRVTRLACSRTHWLPVNGFGCVGEPRMRHSRGSNQ